MSLFKDSRHRTEYEYVEFSIAIEMKQFTGLH